ncbi:phosphotransferase [Nocardia sp. GCM10030253]|uniref:phosphotransferase n=1 Tax=Nocardia sp. GCM10030253 TaxID=3273404 RepID=UPI0036405B71
MGSDIAQRLPRLLGAWPFSGVRVVDELTDLGDRARVWRVRTNSGDYVAKLTFDGRGYVEPGLRIASVVDRAGISTGAPVTTVDGALCVKVYRWRGSWTLAVLELVEGTPFDWSEPELCGELLGRVHRILLEAGDVTPAGKLLDFYTAEAGRIGGREGNALNDALAAVREFDRDIGLSYGVLYGDPAPEILRKTGSGELALIDWGTPSWGPLLHDVVCWHRFGSAAQPHIPDIAERLLAAYRTRVHIGNAELAATQLFDRLHRAIQAASIPRSR